jgi:hypothetical protein
MRLPNRSVLDLLLGSKFNFQNCPLPLFEDNKQSSTFPLIILMVKCSFEVPLQMFLDRWLAHAIYLKQITIL